MAQKKIYSDIELQKILESDEFYEDLIQFDDNSNSNEENILPNITLDDRTITNEKILPVLEVITLPEIEQNTVVLELDAAYEALNHNTLFKDLTETNNELLVFQDTVLPENPEIQTYANSAASEPTNNDNDLPPDEQIEKVLPNYETENDQSPNEQQRTEPMEQSYEGEKDLRRKNKRLREKGRKYKTLKKDKVTGKYSYGEEKEERRLRATCQSVLCKKAKNRFCNTFSPNDRRDIFLNFWRMSWDMRKVYVSSLVKTVTTKRPKEDNSSRLLTFEYYLKKNSEDVRICKKMFLNTLDLKEWMVRNWLNEASNNKLKDSKDVAMPSKARLPAELKKGLEVLHTFLDNLPKLESHYCRASSNRLYLEPLFQTKTDVYRLYKDYCTLNSAKELSLVHFKKQMTLKNIYIHKPKKDQCDVCIGYKTKNVMQEEFEKHIKRKDEARCEKEKDKKMAMETTELAVFTMDVQAVKLAPALRASTIYYKTKLCVNNFTTFNLGDKEVSCYLWHEAEGGLEANIFATIITRHIFDYLEKNPQTKTIVLYSDGCGYQNRNTILSNALYHFVQATGVIVIQKFLEKGHTQMEVDSVHSLIERKLKNKDIKLPSDYVEVCQKARLKQPFQVKFLDHTWFQNFSKLQYYSSIRPGQKKNDLHVKDIRCLKYEKTEGISFKSHYSDNWTVLPQRIKIVKNPQIGPLYQSRIKIKEQKYKDLQALKAVLPLDVHEFYDALPH